MIAARNGNIAMYFDPRVVQTVPHARVVQKNGKQFIVLPHRPEETKLLGNLGYDVPLPILSYYDWAGGKPYAHQKVTAGLMTQHRRGYVLNGMGSGKTRSALFAFDYLRSIGEATRMLVVAPLSTLTPTWEAEVFSAFRHFETIVLHGTRDQRKQLLHTPADIYVINHDGVHILIDQLRDRRDIDFVVVDELTAFKNTKTRRWKAMNQVAAQKKWVWGMTGAPTPNEPAEAFGQIKLITPHTGPKYYKAFREETMYQVGQFTWIPRDEANEVVHTAMQPSVRFATEDCIDLPPVSFLDRHVNLSKEQANVYKEVKEKCYAQWQDGEITAMNAGVAMGKLLQICCGWVYGADRSVMRLKNDDRITEVYDIVEQATGKVIVFAPYRHAVDELTAMMRFRYANHAVEKIYGGVTKKERDRIFSLFKGDPKLRVLVAHPKSMSHGLNLVEANTIIWYSPPDSLEVFEQANARIRRPGQTKHQNIVCIRSSAIENIVYSRLKRRQDVQNALLDMFRQQ